MKRITCIVFAMMLPAGGMADGALILSDAQLRSGHPHSAAAYLTIANQGSGDCRLRGAASDLAARVELHRTVEEGGVMKMRPLEAITIAAGGHHDLQPGGDHIMLMGLHRPLAQGRPVPIRLDFGDCGVVDQDFPVVPLAGAHH